MGNSLCKSQPPNRSRNQFEEFLAGCTNFCSCPSGIPANRNHHWKKQVIETRPPYLGAHTTSTKWHQAPTLTSTQPLRQNHVFDKAPVPPPRKKRTLQRSRSYEDVEFVKKDGFKDVFGQPVPLERQRASASVNHIYHMDETNSNKSNNSFGNKKTDKFFGENLSDSLSNERYSPVEAGILSSQKDDLDIFVEKNVAKVESDRASSVDERLSDSLNKKAAFLMTMLDESPDKKKSEEEDDDERYRGMVPVEEQIIVPKRRITKCICDETDHLLHHLRHDECHKHGKIEENTEELKKLVTEKQDKATETPPIKPKRDLTLYRQSMDLSDVKDGSKSPEEEVPSPPLRRGKQVQNLMEQIEAHLPHYLDLEADIQHDSYIDGSAAVSEKISKLKERKISKNSDSGLQSGTVPEDKFVLGCRDVTISPLHFKEELSGSPKSESPLNWKRSESPANFKDNPELLKEKSPEKELIEKIDSKVTENEPKVEVEPKPEDEKVRPEKKMSVRLQNDGVHQLEELIRHQQFNTTEDVINEIYKNQTNIVYEFQRFLEDELNKEENVSKLDKTKPDPVEELLESQSIDLVSNSTSSETSSEASTIKNLSDNDSDITLPAAYNSIRRESVDDLDTWFSTNPSHFPNLEDTHFDLVSTSDSSDNASTIRALSPSSEDEDHMPELLRNNHLLKTQALDNRRESIEDVDTWFTQHLDVPHVNLSQSLVNEDAKKAEFLTYDGKLYPFGQPRERQMSLTDEFFAREANEEEKSRPKNFRRSNSESSY